MLFLWIHLSSAPYDGDFSAGDILMNGTGVSQRPFSFYFKFIHIPCLQKFTKEGRKKKNFLPVNKRTLHLFCLIYFRFYLQSINKGQSHL